VDLQSTKPVGPQLADTFQNDGPWSGQGGWIPGSTARMTSLVEGKPDRSSQFHGVRAGAGRSRARVLLADPRSVNRDAMGAWLGSDPGIEVVAKASNPTDAEDLAFRLCPDVFVASCDGPGCRMAGIGERLARRQPKLRIVVISHSHSVASCGVARLMGAWAHLCDDDEPADVLATIRGRSFIGLEGSPRQCEACGRVEHPEAPPSLSKRERDVLVNLSRGLSAKQVAGELGICPKTVDNHTQRLMRKLGVHCRADVVRFAVRHGYVPA